MRTVEIEDRDYERKGVTKGYLDAADMLKRGELDAAIFCSGTPTEAVREVLEEGKGYLLNLEVTPEQVQAATPEFENVFTPVDIPTHFYEGQTQPIHTLATQVILVCRKDLSNRLALQILDVLFDNVEELLLAHSQAEDIMERWEEVDELTEPLVRATRSAPDASTYDGGGSLEERDVSGSGREEGGLFTRKKERREWVGVRMYCI